MYGRKFDVYVDPAGWIWARMGDDYNEHHDLSPTEARAMATLLNRAATEVEATYTNEEN